MWKKKHNIFILDFDLEYEWEKNILGRHEKSEEGRGLKRDEQYRSGEAEETRTINVEKKKKNFFFDFECGSGREKKQQEQHVKK